jgi:gas vesicle protein
MATTLETLLQSLPSREDLANAVGLETRSSASSEVLSAISLFGTGMLFGAGLALLFAPKSGSEMRRDLSEGMREYGYGQGERSEHGSRSEYAGSSRSGDRQMASQTGSGSSPYSSSSSQQDYPHQMSGQTTTQQSRQKS